MKSPEILQFKIPNKSKWFKLTFKKFMFTYPKTTPPPTNTSYQPLPQHTCEYPQKFQIVK